MANFHGSIDLKNTVVFHLGSICVFSWLRYKEGIQFSFRYIQVGTNWVCKCERLNMVFRFWFDIPFILTVCPLHWQCFSTLSTLFYITSPFLTQSFILCFLFYYYYNYWFCCFCCCGCCCCKYILSKTRVTHYILGDAVGVNLCAYFHLYYICIYVSVQRSTLISSCETHSVLRTIIKVYGQFLSSYIIYNKTLSIQYPIYWSYEFQVTIWLI